MSNRIEKEMTDLRCALDKALLSSEVEALKDLLVALDKLPISIELLKATKIGQTLQEIKKKFVNDELGTQSKTLISKWKKECENQNNSVSKSESTGSLSKLESTSSSDDKPKLVRAASVDAEDDFSEDLYNQLPAMRKTVD